MRNIKVDEKFEEQLWKRKLFFREKYGIELSGTSLTKAIGKLMEMQLIFPIELSEAGFLGVEEIRERKKLTNMEITFKMMIPVRNGHKNQITINN